MENHGKPGTLEVQHLWTNLDRVGGGVRNPGGKRSRIPFKADHGGLGALPWID